MQQHNTNVGEICKCEKQQRVNRREKYRISTQSIKESWIWAASYIYPTIFSFIVDVRLITHINSINSFFLIQWEKNGLLLLQRINISNKKKFEGSKNYI